MGRQVADNLIVVQEVLHSMKQKTKAKGTLPVKIDLEKAYDK